MFVNFTEEEIAGLIEFKNAGDHELFMDGVMEKINNNDAKTTFTKMEDGAITTNPFKEDLMSMGTQLSKELWFMSCNHADQSLTIERLGFPYLYNIDTGERISITIKK
jgi:hypothetical protein